MAGRMQHRYSSTSLIHLAKSIAQTPAADPGQDRNKTLAPTKTISREDFFPGALVDENDRPMLLLFPENKVKMAWDCLALLFIAYLAAIVPYQIAFMQESMVGLQWVDVVAQAFFMMDLVLHFNTAYYDKGKLVCQRRLIAIHYLKGMLWVDLVASFPYEWVVLGAQTAIALDPDTLIPYTSIMTMRTVKLVNFIRLLKLLRLVRLKRILIDIEDFLSSQTLATIFSLTRLLLAAFLIAHWNACCWYLVSLLDSYEQPSTWVKEYGLLTTNGASGLDAYIASLYWAFTTMNTIGYGDIRAYSMNEKICAIVALVISSMVFSLIVGNISGMVSKSTELEAEHKDKAVQLNAYMRAMKLPGDLRFRVRRYLDYAWENQAKSKIEEDDILKLLSEPLREEIYVHTRGPVLRSFSLFDSFPVQFVSHLGKILAPEMFAPGDVICEERETRAVLFFILQGTVEVYHKSTNSSLMLLGKRKYLGEIAFFTRQPRKASARCIDFASVLSINRDNVDLLLAKMPEPKEVFDRIQEKCKEGDYSILKVVCYLCRGAGHVALNCNRLYLNVYKDDIRLKWLKSKQGTSHMVRLSDKPNFRRLKHKVRRHRGHIFSSVVGMPREAEELFPGRPSLCPKIRKFVQTTDPRSQRPRVSITLDPSMPPAAMKAARPRWSIFIKSTPEPPDSDGEEVHRPEFNQQLLELYHQSQQAGTRARADSLFARHQSSESSSDSSSEESAVSA